MNLLIADDETLIREAIAARLKKGNYEFHEIYQAGNGIEAWNTIRQVRPEIIITDVRMDGMNGIQLIKNCQSLDTGSAVIVISGYAEFEYVQNAMYHGACCYLLKPITQEALFDAVDKAMGKYREITRLSQVQEQNLLLTADRLLDKCRHTELETCEYSQLLSLIKAEPGSRFLAASVHISRYDQTRCFSHENVYSVLRDRLLTQSPLPFRVLTGENSKNRILLFYGKEADTCICQLQELLTSQIRKMNVLGSSITLGISRTAAMIGPELFRESERALNRRFLYGNGAVYQAPADTDSDSHFPEGFGWKALDHELHCKTPAQVTVRISGLLDSFCPLVHNIEYLIQYIYEMLIRLGFSPDRKRWDLFMESKCWADCENKEEILLRVKEEISATCEHRMDSTRQSVTEQARDFMANHYREDISLDDLAERFHLNPRYFSTIFKKKEGIGPIDYLTGIRMDHAKQYLHSSDIPASDIALQVGYEDARYFYKVFKKYTGLTPKEYRNRQKQLP